METTSEKVNFQFDGLALTPDESVKLLAEIQRSENIVEDSYSNGGVVEKLEKEMARVLGKEQAIFMPSGTLANHIAIRDLAGNDKRVLVQEKSHIYNDSGDCLQNLSGLNPIPLRTPGEENAGFTLEQVKNCLSMTSEGKVQTRIGVLSIESPVRRMNGMMVSMDEIKKITDYARRKGIRTHLDGARLFIAAAYTGRDVSDYSALFDTVYVSLYKYFNAPFGAILAGTNQFIENLYHQRRMFGGGLNQAWTPCALALHSLKGFSERYQKVINLSIELNDSLNRLDGVSIENITNGTNVYRMVLDKTIDPSALRKNLEEHNVVFPLPDSQFNGFYFKTNESLINCKLPQLMSSFQEALRLSIGIE